MRPRGKPGNINGKMDAAVLSHSKRQGIRKRDGLHHHHDLVEAVFPFPEYVKCQVDFCLAVYCLQNHHSFIIVNTF